ncbi:hypothetical protein Tco_0323808, partial [Tanacetum coccineum]
LAFKDIDVLCLLQRTILLPGFLEAKPTGLIPDVWRARKGRLHLCDQAAKVKSKHQVLITACYHKNAVQETSKKSQQEERERRKKATSSKILARKKEKEAERRSNKEKKADLVSIRKKKRKKDRCQLESKESQVKSIMDAYGLWGTVEPRGLGEEPDEKKSKQALSVFVYQTIPRRQGRLDFNLRRSLKLSRMKEVKRYMIVAKLNGIWPRKKQTMKWVMEASYGRGERGRVMRYGSSGDKSMIPVFDCGELGHFGYECTKWKDKDEANLIQDEELALL